MNYVSLRAILSKFKNDAQDIVYFLLTSEFAFGIFQFARKRQPNFSFSSRSRKRFAENPHFKMQLEKSKI